MARTFNRTLAELLDTIDSQEITLWAAAYSLDPWGEDRADLRAGIIAATQANCFRSKGKPYSPSQFMPQFGKVAKTAEESLADLRAWVLRHQKAT